MKAGHQNDKNSVVLDRFQGFEVVIDGRKYFAYSKYTGSGSEAISYCDQTMPGWSHDVLGHDWACFFGHKVQKVAPKLTIPSGYLENR